MDLIDRLRTYASTRKGELAELITEAADALDRQTCEDAVSRRQAIAAVSNWLYDRDDGRSVDQLLSTLPSVQPLVIHCTDCEDWLERQSILGVTISELPAVQPEPKPDKNGSEPFGNAEMLSDRTTDDCVSRQAAIDALADMHCKSDEDGYVWIIRSDAWARIDALPSAQPEIIHCKECKYGVQDEDKRWHCRGLGCQVGEADGSGFCADAERRTDE